MEKKFILTAFSKDRPGVVADISEVIYENGCNLEDATMTNMLNEFAIILLFAGKGDGLLDRLLNECRRLEREKAITAFIRPVDPPGTAQPETEPKKTINVEGIDQSGIVFNVSRYLASNGINIEKLTSRKSASPEAGTIHYFMEIEVRLPGNFSAEKLEEGLSRVGEKLNLEISVH
jgi:glycine cleavage system transcriptional repressor